MLCIICGDVKLQIYILDGLYGKGNDGVMALYGSYLR